MAVLDVVIDPGYQTDRESRVVGSVCSSVQRDMVDTSDGTPIYMHIPNVQQSHLWRSSACVLNHVILCASYDFESFLILDDVVGVR